MKRAEVAIIVPAYNESKTLPEVLSELSRHFGRVICIDDGSNDLTAEYIQRTNTYMVRHPINLGQGAALQTGIEFALSDPSVRYLVTYDADGQHNVADVLTMLKCIKQHNLDVVLGSRFLGTTSHIHFPRRWLLRAAVAFTNLSSGIKLSDTHNGLRVFSRQAAEKLNLQMPDFSHASEIIEKIAENKFTFQEVPVTINYTKYSIKKGQSILNAVNIGFDVLLYKMIRS
jgi:glycosyltransferase involved in cell wall biosynthesis